MMKNEVTITKWKDEITENIPVNNIMKMLLTCETIAVVIKRTHYFL